MGNQFAFVKFLQHLLMSGEGENSGIDLKLFMQAVQEQFHALTTRLDNLQSPSRLGGFRRVPHEKEKEECLDYDMNSSGRGKKVESKSFTFLSYSKYNSGSFSLSNVRTVILMLPKLPSESEAER